MTNWLKLVRWPNLLIIVFIFAIFRYSLLIPFDVATSLNNFQYVLLMLSVVLIMAGGNAINDVYDRKADKINKPGKNPVGNGIPEKKARIFYWVTSIVGLLLGYFMGYSVGMFMLGSIHLIAFFLLWMYSTDFKHRPYLGNLIVALLASMVIAVIFLFDVVPANRQAISNGDYDNLLYVFLMYLCFSFISTLIRELIKDYQDLKGDRRVGSKTLAVVLSQTKYKVVIVAHHLIMIALTTYVTYILWEVKPLAGYVAILILVPTLVDAIIVGKAKRYKDWKWASRLMKSIMISGILFLVLFSFGG